MTDVIKQNGNSVKTQFIDSFGVTSASPRISAVMLSQIGRKSSLMFLAAVLMCISPEIVLLITEDLPKEGRTLTKGI